MSPVELLTTASLNHMVELILCQLTYVIKVQISLQNAFRDEATTLLNMADSQHSDIWH